MKKIILGNDEYIICKTCGSKRNSEDFSLECPVCQDRERKKRFMLDPGDNQKFLYMLQLRKEGKTYSEIGKRVGVSPQRIHQILKDT